MLAHIHIMKTAGQTVCDLLRASLGANHCDLRAGSLATASDVQFAQRFYSNLQCIAGHAVRPRGDLLAIPSIRFFTFLRDPIARCISHYQFERNKNKRNIDFLSWLEQNAEYQTRILCGSRDPQLAIDVLEKHVTFVGLVEDFNRSLKLLSNWSELGLATDYESRNIAADKTVKQEILADTKLMTAIRDAHVADLIVYEHVVNSIYPMMIQKYGDESSQAKRPPVSLPLWGVANERLSTSHWQKHGNASFVLREHSHHRYPTIRSDAHG